MNAVDAAVVGVIDPGTRKYEERYVVGPLPLIQSLMGSKDISAYGIELVEGVDARAFSERLTTEAKAHGLKLEVAPWDEGPYGSFFRAVVGFLSVFKTFVLLVLGFVAVMSIVNTLSRNVVERIPEIGSLRSIGFLRRHIAGIFAVEGFVLAFIACAVSSLVILAGSFLLDRLQIQYAVGIASVPLPLKISISPVACLTTAGILCLAAILAALGPARRAARLNIGEALRHV